MMRPLVEERAMFDLGPELQEAVPCTMPASRTAPRRKALRARPRGGLGHRRPAAAPPPPEDSAAEAGLRYVSDTSPGIRRKRSGTGFTYVGQDGKRITDQKTLERIRKLAIPPV